MEPTYTGHYNDLQEPKDTEEPSKDWSGGEAVSDETFRLRSSGRHIADITLRLFPSC